MREIFLFICLILCTTSVFTSPPPLGHTFSLTQVHTVILAPFRRQHIRSPPPALLQFIPPDICPIRCCSKRPIQTPNFNLHDPSSSLFGTTGYGFFFFEKISYFLSDKIYLGYLGYEWIVFLIKFRYYFKTEKHRYFTVQCQTSVILEVSIVPTLSSKLLTPSSRCQVPDFFQPLFCNRFKFFFLILKIQFTPHFQVFKIFKNCFMYPSSKSGFIMSSYPFFVKTIMMLQVSKSLKHHQQLKNYNFFF